MDWLIEQVTDKVLARMGEWFVQFAIDYTASLPIMFIACIGVYALCRMFSSKVAGWGVVGVLVYGAIAVAII
jgi:hypothetical protein